MENNNWEKNECFVLSISLLKESTCVRNIVNFLVPEIQSMHILLAIPYEIFFVWYFGFCEGGVALLFLYLLVLILFFFIIFLYHNYLALFSSFVSEMIHLIEILVEEVYHFL